MSRSKRIPELLTRKSPSTGRALAYARFDGRVVSFGAMGSEAEQQFQQTLAEWLANGRRLPEADAKELTVADVIAEYPQHAEQEYREVEVDKLRRQRPGDGVTRVRRRRVPAEQARGGGQQGTLVRRPVVGPAGRDIERSRRIDAAPRVRRLNPGFTGCAG
ncbi:MAG: hypothetical protein KDE27_21680 [Planctomycetes bacterium]|nr:hypothetical protein [Planctomycetota bacterium]